MDRALVPPTCEAVVPDAHRPNAMVENARREFAGVFGDLARGKRNWQVVAFALAGVVAAEALAMIGLARAARVVPYVVRIDQLGRVDAVGPASPMRDPDATLVASQLADFIRSVRTVLPLAAVNAQTALLRHGYAFATPEAAGFLNAYLSDPAHDPRVVGLRLTREVQVTSALKVPEATSGRKRTGDDGAAQTWRLQWTETDRPTQLGDSTATTAWEGYLTLRVAPPTTAESVQENPLGLYITSIAWTRVAQQAQPVGQAQMIDSPPQATRSPRATPGGGVHP
jgi:type IV secretion system protein TrbF